MRNGFFIFNDLRVRNEWTKKLREERSVKLSILLNLKHEW